MQTRERRDVVRIQSECEPGCYSHLISYFRHRQTVPTPRSAMSVGKDNMKVPLEGFAPRSWPSVRPSSWSRPDAGTLGRQSTRQKRHFCAGRQHLASLDGELAGGGASFEWMGLYNKTGPWRSNVCFPFFLTTVSLTIIFQPLRLSFLRSVNKNQHSLK